MKRASSKAKRHAVGRSVPTCCSASDLAKLIPFRMVAHLNMGTIHELHYLNKPLNIACVITTPHLGGKPGKAKREYAINHKQTTWHPTLADLLDKNLDLAMRALSLYSQNPGVHPSDGASPAVSGATRCSVSK